MRKGILEVHICLTACIIIKREHFITLIWCFYFQKLWSKGKWVLVILHLQTLRPWRRLVSCAWKRWRWRRSSKSVSCISSSSWSYSFCHTKQEIRTPTTLPKISKTQFSHQCLVRWVFGAHHFWRVCTYTNFVWSYFVFLSRLPNHKIIGSLLVRFCQVCIPPPGTTEGLWPGEKLCKLTTEGQFELE